MVADMDRAHLQNFAGVMEPGELESKHCPDPARPRLAIQMDRLAPRRERCFHDVLSPPLSKTDRGSADFGDNTKSGKAERRTFSSFRRRLKSLFLAGVQAALGCDPA